MPARAYVDTLPTFRHDLLTRLAAGEHASEICAAPGAPSYGSVYAWARREPDFAAALARARAQGAARRRGAFDEGRAQALADRIVARAAAGEPLLGLLNAGQGLPCRNVVIRWRRMSPEFDQALRLAVRIARRRAHAQARCSPAVLAAIVGGVRRGHSLAALSGRRGVPCKATLYAWMRTRPDFAAEVFRARRDRDLTLADRLLILTETPGRMAANRAEVARLRRRLSDASPRCDGSEPMLGVEQDY